ncbi:MAG: hypothetical protein ACUVSY_00770 [Roseiflexus sp.]
MNFANDNRRSVVVGAGLILLGFIWWLNLWWLLLPGVLIAGGIAAYIQRRALRTSEAVHAALWGIGLGVLLLIDFLFPGILFLAGVSLLIRGREAGIDAQVYRFIGDLRRPRQNLRPTESTRVPVVMHPGAASQTPFTPEDRSTTGETTRLRE